MSKKITTNPEDDIQLPDPREVNRQERLKRQREKEDERMAKRGVGLFVEPLKVACERYGGDPHAQIEYLFQKKTVPAAIGRHRFVSDGRLDACESVMHLVVRLLRANRANIRNMSELGKRHVIAAMKAWEADGLSEGTIQGYLSILRRWFCLTGKPDLLPTDSKLREWLRDNGLTAGTIGREQIPELAKGWRACGVSPELFIETLCSQGEYVCASIVEMALRWGFRDEEGWFCRPHISEQDGNGQGLMLRRGTKGDKVRLVKWFKDPERARLQREALDRAKALADLHPRGELAIPGLTATQMENHFKWVMHKNGATKKGMGVTPHGLRHQFGCDLFEDLTGMPAPVLGMLPAEAYRQNAAIVRAAMKEISLQMGHERPSISGAYIGSVSKLGKGQTRRTKDALQKVIPAYGAFRAAAVQEAWLVGAYGRGAIPAPDEPMEIAVRPGSPEKPLTLPEVAEMLRGIQQAVENASGLPVRMHVWLAPEMPEPAAEILFTQNCDSKGPAAPVEASPQRITAPAPARPTASEHIDGRE